MELYNVLHEHVDVLELCNPYIIRLNKWGNFLFFHCEVLSFVSLFIELLIYVFIYLLYLLFIYDIYFFGGGDGGWKQKKKLDAVEYNSWWNNYKNLK